jgi:GntR family transcriptional regulator
MLAYKHAAMSHDLLAGLRIENTGVPIYVQLRDQILAAIGGGRLRPGERLPTMREVAIALRIDLNTVRRAYDALARAGAVTLLPARGTFVADRPPSPDSATLERRLDDAARRTLALAASRGLDPVALARRILAIATDKDSQP